MSDQEELSVLIDIALFRTWSFYWFGDMVRRKKTPVPSYDQRWAKLHLKVSCYKYKIPDRPNDSNKIIDILLSIAF